MADGDAQIEALRSEVRTLTRTVDRLVEKMELISQISVKADDDHEMRIRKLEAWKYAVPASLLLMLASIVGTLLRR